MATADAFMRQWGKEMSLCFLFFGFAETVSYRRWSGGGLFRPDRLAGPGTSRPDGTHMEGRPCASIIVIFMEKFLRSKVT